MVSRPLAASRRSPLAVMLPSGKAILAATLSRSGVSGVTPSGMESDAVRMARLERFCHGLMARDSEIANLKGIKPESYAAMHGAQGKGGYERRFGLRPVHARHHHAEPRSLLNALIAYRAIEAANDVHDATYATARKLEMPSTQIDRPAHGN